MPRRKRLVIPGLPHHVTQRGVQRKNVFYSDMDRAFYLVLLSENVHRYGASLLCYCLMENHVHILIVPHFSDSLRWIFQYTHQRYAIYLNSRMGWTGHLWQQRFYSSPVDHDYLWVAIRYILRNPVEAHGLAHPAEYRWSSAAAHCGQAKESIISENSKWGEILKTRRDWIPWLADNESFEKTALLRLNTSRDLPTGSESWISSLELEHGSRVRAPKLGRPKKEKS